MKCYYSDEFVFDLTDGGEDNSPAFAQVEVVGNGTTNTIWLYWQLFSGSLQEESEEIFEGTFSEAIRHAQELFLGKQVEIFNNNQ